MLAPAPAAGLAGARGGLGGGGVAGLNTALTQQGLANRTAGATMYGATTAERATGGLGDGRSRVAQTLGSAGWRLRGWVGGGCTSSCSARLPRDLSARCLPLPTPAVVLGKLAHYGLLLGLPWALHGGEPALWGAASYAVTQSIVLASTFAVSHNVPESKPTGEGEQRRPRARLR